ncbi:unnamed protein product [Didymodactylos carnosus]|uniref:Uncharacterized protein n=1 Tax=Didymodactylos carnosus TaxID=1234261 RepID=A0A815EZH3_9BILA|nr:unnamed protein product [Didymodactylos carnosus]CAF1318194.1 unnamed protein product [Didymodactylos carnosus]CAF3953664.1 unnamed protein product [Didymodactylos carnosus]CAF4161738.1 unnamed protein product [Didymodactylos carnosus]
MLDFVVFFPESGVVHERPYVVWTILIEDMNQMVESFRIELAARVATLIDDTQNRHQQIKLLQEHWNKLSTNKRGCGFYTKQPEDYIMNHMTSSLANPPVINDNLSLPQLLPEWLNCAVTLLLSIENIRRRTLSAQSNLSPLLKEIAIFIDHYCTGLYEKKLKRKETTKAMKTQFAVVINSQLQAIKWYYCTNCGIKLRVLVVYKYIPINVINGQLSLERELTSFFHGATSDRHCKKCSDIMVRRMQVLNWPDVLILTINDQTTTTIKRYSRKPSKVFSLYPYNDVINICINSKCIFDLTTFISLKKSGTSNKLVRITKIDKKWSTSFSTKLIGEGVDLCELYAHNQVIILERVRRSLDVNMINAIIRCCSTGFTEDGCDFVDGPCESLFDAVHAIENNPKSVHVTVDDHVAIPITTNLHETNGDCSLCGCSLNNDIILDIYSQRHYHSPKILSYLLQTIAYDEFLELNVELNDDEGNIIHYQSHALLLISRFTDSITVLKLENRNDFYSYKTNPYTQKTKCTNAEIADCFCTSSKSVVFLIRVNV